MSESDEVKSSSMSSLGGRGEDDDKRSSANQSSASSTPPQSLSPPASSPGGSASYLGPIFWPGACILPPAPPPVVYRRMTPEEDLIATQQGINLLVKQRSDLVNKLVQHHNKLLRSNEIDSLTNFSRQIDAIMRIRGIAVMPSPNPSSLRAPPLPKKTKIKRGITFDYAQ